MALTERLVYHKNHFDENGDPKRRPIARSQMEIWRTLFGAVAFVVNLTTLVIVASAHL